MEHIPKIHRVKTTIYNVGPDRWGNPLALDLCVMILTYIAQDSALPMSLRTNVGLELVRRGEKA